MTKNHFGFPAYEIETPFGPALLTVQDSDRCYVSSYENKETDKGLTINGVAYRTSLCAQYVGGEWTWSHYDNGRPDYTSLYMSRIGWTNVNQMDATPAARKKAGEVLFGIINQFFADNPDVPRAARVVKLRNDLAGQQQKHHEAILLQEEAQRQIDATRAELVGLLDDEGRKAAYNVERGDLIKEKESRSLRDEIINERMNEIDDLLCLLRGRRGSQSRYLSRAEILKLADYFDVKSNDPDDLGHYLKGTDFSPSAGACYEVPVTWEEGRELDRACELLGLGQ